MSEDASTSLEEDLRPLLHNKDVENNENSLSGLTHPPKTEFPDDAWRGYAGGCQGQSVPPWASAPRLWASSDWNLSSSKCRGLENGIERQKGWKSFQIVTLFRQLTFTFVSSLLRLGTDGKLGSASDLAAEAGSLPHLERQPQHLRFADHVQQLADGENNKAERKYSVFRVLIRFIGPRAWPLGFLRLTEILLSILTPLILKTTVSSVESSSIAENANLTAERGASSSLSNFCTAKNQQLLSQHKCSFDGIKNDWSAPGIPERHHQLLWLCIGMIVIVYAQLIVSVQYGFLMRKIALKAKSSILAAIHENALRSKRHFLPFNDTNNYFSSEVRPDHVNEEAFPSKSSYQHSAGVGVSDYEGSADVNCGENTIYVGDRLELRYQNMTGQLIVADEHKICHKCSCKLLPHFKESTEVTKFSQENKFCGCICSSGISNETSPELQASCANLIPSALPQNVYSHDCLTASHAVAGLLADAPKAQSSNHQGEVNQVGTRGSSLSYQDGSECLPDSDVCSWNSHSYQMGDQWKGKDRQPNDSASDISSKENDGESVIGPPEACIVGIQRKSTLGVLARATSISDMLGTIAYRAVTRTFQTIDGINTAAANAAANAVKSAAKSAERAAAVAADAVAAAAEQESSSGSEAGSGESYRSAISDVDCEINLHSQLQGSPPLPDSPYACTLSSVNLEASAHLNGFTNHQITGETTRIGVGEPRGFQRSASAPALRNPPHILSLTPILDISIRPTSNSERPNHFSSEEHWEMNLEKPIRLLNRRERYNERNRPDYLCVKRVADVPLKTQSEVSKIQSANPNSYDSAGNHDGSGSLMDQVAQHQNDLGKTYASTVRPGFRDAVFLTPSGGFSGERPGEYGRSEKETCDSGFESMAEGKFLAVSGSRGPPSSSAVEIINLVSVDSERMQAGICIIHEVWATPLTLALSLFLVYCQIPGAFFQALGITVVCLLLQVYVASRLQRLTQRIMVCRDARVRACRQAFLYIRQLKLMAWEHSIFKRVLGHRGQELIRLRWRYFLHASSNYFFVSTPLVVKVVALSCLVLSCRGGLVRVSSLFAALALLDKALNALNGLPLLLNDLTAAAVALKRLSRFLVEEAPCPLYRGTQESTRCSEDDKAERHSFSCSKRFVAETCSQIQTIFTNSVSLRKQGNVWDSQPYVIEFIKASFSWSYGTSDEHSDVQTNSSVTAEGMCGLYGIRPADAALNANLAQEKDLLCGDAKSSTQSMDRLGVLQIAGGRKTEPLGGFCGSFSGAVNGSCYALSCAGAVILEATIRIRPGELHLIVGSSGGGKTSLLLAVLGELVVVGGSAYLNLPNPYKDDSRLQRTCKRENSLHCFAADAETPILEAKAKNCVVTAAGSGREDIEAMDSYKTGVSLGGKDTEYNAPAAHLTESISADTEDHEELTDCCCDLCDVWEFIAYSAQQPVIFGGSIMDNIVLGRPHVHAAYRRVVEACALAPDLERLGGDSSLLDAGGHSLSQGQRARLSLARAIYSAAVADEWKKGYNTNCGTSGCGSYETRRCSRRLLNLGSRALFLIDDPFCSLDTVTTLWVWQHVFAEGGILWGKTVLLVTNLAAEAIQKDSCVSSIIQVEGGRVHQFQSWVEFRHETQCFGGPSLTACTAPPRSIQEAPSKAFELPREVESTMVVDSLLSLKRNKTFAQQPLGERDGRSENTIKNSDSSVEGFCKNGSNDENTLNLLHHTANDRMMLKTIEKDELVMKYKEGQCIIPVATPVQPEKTRHGSVSWRVWYMYLTTAGSKQIIFLLISSCTSAYCSALSDSWLRIWTSRHEHFMVGWVRAVGSASMLNENVVYLIVYWVLALISIFFSIITTLSYVSCALNASSELHSKMLASLLRAQCSWFNAEPFGRILNRFSDDVFALDEIVPSALHSFVLIATALLARLTLLGKSAPAVIFALPFLAAFLLSTARTFRRTIRALKRLETIARSPLHSLMSEGLTNGVTIRAFRAEARYYARYLHALWVYTDTTFLNICAQAWLALRLQFIGATVQAVFLLSIAIPTYLQPSELQKERGEFAGILALGLYTAMPIVRLLTTTITTFIRAEMQMVSVERIRDYILVSSEDSSYDALSCKPKNDDEDHSSEKSRFVLYVPATTAERQPLLKSNNNPSLLCARRTTRESQQPLVLHPALPPTLQLCKNTPAALAACMAAKQTLDSVSPHRFILKGKFSPLRPENLIVEGSGDLEQISNISARNRLPLQWPSLGRIDFENVSVDYGGTPAPALLGVSLTIHPGETVGMVGRTGAGKSSLLLALARMVNYKGVIRVDGVDILSVPVNILRSALAFMPQSPVLFSGTIRSNLDPESVHSDGTIYQALRLCKLDQVIGALPKGLDTSISAVDDTSAVEIRIKRSRRTNLAQRGGSWVFRTNMDAIGCHRRLIENGSVINFSQDLSKDDGSAMESPVPCGRMKQNHGGMGCVNMNVRLSLGQQQLLCFCRVLLRKSKVMCLDEVNSAIDASVESEVLRPVLQQTLRNKTILLVSHRLCHMPSICQKICVFQRSRLVEVGPPNILLTNPTSAFHRLFYACSEIGMQAETNGNQAIM